ncbi:MAG: thioredoxin family protein [Proteiniphilum sp.]|jgi:hypothetical protein|nr:thioredoxin family protein [Proteiniphilum sp.]
MDDKNTIHIKPWHFLLAIIIFTISTGIVTKKKVNSIPLSEQINSKLTDVDEIDLDKDGLTFLFFYRDSSELCQKMRYNIENMNVENIHNIHLYAMNIEEHDEYYYKYNISGIPNLLIFSGDTEMKRIMGIVSTGNLEKIVKRIKPY